VEWIDRATAARLQEEELAGGQDVAILQATPPGQDPTRNSGQGNRSTSEPEQVKPTQPPRDPDPAGGSGVQGHGGVGTAANGGSATTGPGDAGAQHGQRGQDGPAQGAGGEPAGSGQGSGSGDQGSTNTHNAGGASAPATPPRAAGSAAPGATGAEPGALGGGGPGLGATGTGTGCGGTVDSPGAAGTETSGAGAGAGTGTRGDGSGAAGPGTGGPATDRAGAANRGPGTRTGAAPGGDGGGRRPPQRERTFGDRVIKYFGCLNFEFGGGSDLGKSGGIPGGQRTHNWGGWGQALYALLSVVNTVLMFFGGGELKAAWAGLKASLKSAAAAALKLFTREFWEAAGSKLASLLARDGAAFVRGKCSEWFAFFADKGGITIPGAKSGPWFWPSYASVVHNFEAVGTWAFRDTAAHEEDPALRMAVLEHSWDRISAWYEAQIDQLEAIYGARSTPRIRYATSEAATSPRWASSPVSLTRSSLM
jgi:hypothetical protein